MIQASVQSTATLTLGKRYLLAIVNGSAGTITPTIADTFGTAGLFPENSTTAYSVATGVTKWITFFAFTSGLQLNDTSSTVYWLLTPID